jgi:hypothetical protein
MRRNKFGNPNRYAAKQICFGRIDGVIEIENPVTDRLGWKSSGHNGYHSS